jgi:hypothetical protein
MAALQGWQLPRLAVLADAFSTATFVAVAYGVSNTDRSRQAQPRSRDRTLPGLAAIAAAASVLAGFV